MESWVFVNPKKNGVLTPVTRMFPRVDVRGFLPWGGAMPIAVHGLLVRRNEVAVSRGEMKIMQRLSAASH
jgi:hypothetical protein